MDGLATREGDRRHQCPGKSRGAGRTAAIPGRRQAAPGCREGGGRAPNAVEFVWVLSRGYRHSTSSILSAIRRLLDGPSVVADRAAIDHGVAAMAAGGYFADGVIAFDGRRLGGSVFASFDRHAVALIERNGGEVLLLRAMPS
jgi:hypothetical protein